MEDMVLAADHCLLQCLRLTECVMCGVTHFLSLLQHMADCREALFGNVRQRAGQVD